MPDDVRVFVLTGDDRAVRNLVRRVEKLADLKVTGSGVLGAQFDPGQADVLLVQPTDSAQLSASLRSNLPLVLLLANRTLGDVTAEAVLPFDADSTQIRAAILAVAAGLRLQPSAHDRASMDEDELAFLDPLTERELSVLNLLAEGLSNPEIARHLGISRNTVKFHVSSIISKLGAASRTEAVAVGLKRGLIIV
jgi:DNA-binding CsgD family transcriptional regulator